MSTFASSHKTTIIPAKQTTCHASIVSTHATAYTAAIVKTYAAIVSTHDAAVRSAYADALSPADISAVAAAFRST